MGENYTVERPILIVERNQPEGQHCRDTNVTSQNGLL